MELSELIAAETNMYGMIGYVEEQCNRLRNARDEYEKVLTLDGEDVWKQFWDIYYNLDPDSDGYNWEGQRIIDIRWLFENEIINYGNSLSSDYYETLKQMNEKISQWEDRIQELRQKREYYLMCIEEEKKGDK